MVAPPYDLTVLIPVSQRKGLGAQSLSVAQLKVPVAALVSEWCVRNLTQNNTGFESYRLNFRALI